MKTLQTFETVLSLSLSRASPSLSLSREREREESGGTERQNERGGREGERVERGERENPQSAHERVIVERESFVPEMEKKGVSVLL